jgi:hypothetical protein
MCVCSKLGTKLKKDTTPALCKEKDTTPALCIFQKKKKEGKRKRKEKKIPTV